jgi:hypothetical protein
MKRFPPEGRPRICTHACVTVTTVLHSTGFGVVADSELPVPHGMCQHV